MNNVFLFLVYLLPAAEMYVFYFPYPAMTIYIYIVWKNSCHMSVLHESSAKAWTPAHFGSQGLAWQMFKNNHHMII